MAGEQQEEADERFNAAKKRWGTLSDAVSERSSRCTETQLSVAINYAVVNESVLNVVPLPFPFRPAHSQILLISH